MKSMFETLSFVGNGRSEVLSVADRFAAADEERRRWLDEQCARDRASSRQLQQAHAAGLASVRARANDADMSGHRGGGENAPESHFRSLQTILSQTGE